MLAKIALGGELDIASGAELQSGIGKVLDFLNKDEVPRPNFNIISHAEQYTSPTTRVVDLGSPPTGIAWNILGFALAGNDDATVSSAGTVGFYIGAVPATGQPSLGHLRVPRLTIPASQSFTKGTHWCGANDNIVFNLVGLTGPTQFVANVFVAEWREDQIMQLSTR